MTAVAPELSHPATDQVLRWLVRAACFIPVPRAEGEPVELCRWWTDGHADRLIVRGEDDAELQRIAEVDPREPTTGRLVLRDRRTIVGIGDVVREWGRPTWSSSPLRVKVSSMDRDPLSRSTAPAAVVEGWS